MRLRRLGSLLLPALLLATGCGRTTATPKLRPLRVFHAANLTAYFEAVREPVRQDLGLRLQNEPSGTQVACRKVAELGRECDLLLLADPRLVRELLPGVASWRLDFAADEMVLAVGARAPDPDLAEQDWPTVLRQPGTRIGRVNENLAPSGYRTLLVWKLQEGLGIPGLYDELLGKTDKVVEDVTQLTALLKHGELDYAFAYRSLCLAWDLRYIPLDPRVNQGDPARDYRMAEVCFRSLVGDREIRIVGSPIYYTLTVPDQHADAAAALAFIQFILTRSNETWRNLGYQLLPRAQFYGPREKFADNFANLADYAGAQP